MVIQDSDFEKMWVVDGDNYCDFGFGFGFDDNSRNPKCFFDGQEIDVVGVDIPSLTFKRCSSAPRTFLVLATI